MTAHSLLYLPGKYNLARLHSLYLFISMQITNPANHFNINYDNSALYSELFKLGILQILQFLIPIKLLWLKACNLLNKTPNAFYRVIIYSIIMTISHRSFLLIHLSHRLICFGCFSSYWIVRNQLYSHQNNSSKQFITAFLSEPNVLQNCIHSIVMKYLHNLEWPRRS